MKRLLVFIAVVLLPVLGSAQAQINTKKVKISDFTQKITKVVLTGNMFYDNLLENEIVARWKISPYEFCSLAEFEELKKSEDYYFLLTTKAQFKKETEPGLQFLTLVKGGAKAEKGIKAMLEIVSFPFACAEDPSGMESIFFPAFIDLIQDHTLKSMENDIHGYSGLSNYSMNLPETKDMSIVFAKNDLSSQVDEEVIDECFDNRMLITDDEIVEKFLTDTEVNVVISYVAAPAEPKIGSYCYKMLFDNQTHTLYYFRKHKITKKLGVGFLAEDIERISSYRIYY
ncbi:MAG: hypothetical protein IKV75_06330 [Bacteroidales bacterium]|nr:hypothetical protein [Bacteroidales bacterium]